MRAVLYARYSSERQNERSIADQLTVCTRHAEARGWTVVDCFTDAAISGAAMANRPGLHALLAAAEGGGVDVVLTEDEDRLARNLEHLAHIASRLEFAGVQLATLTTDRVEELHVAFKGLQGSQYLKNLSAKTKRGMHSNAEKGLATGARVYGYKSEPGGATAIVEAEAELVRRVFAEYVDGATPREIAARLNLDRIPGPRGGMWNASTINGSRQRGNGLLRLETYAGVKVWNRVQMRKDPRTGQRISTPRPPAEWKRTPVEHLRIIDPHTWAKAQARIEANSAVHPSTLIRRPGVFSGLLKCGRCGATYTAYNDGRLICAAYRERGPAACSNRRTIRRDAVEQRILAALQERLLAPEAVALYVRAYHAAWQRRRATQADRRTPLERRAAELGRRIDRMVDAICDGTATATMRARLVDMEAERETVQAALQAIGAEAEPPIALHPAAAEGYARMVAELQARLAEASGDRAAVERGLVDAARGLVDEVRITPISDDRAAPVDLTLRGTLALFLQGAPAAEQGAYGYGGKVVAGGGLEPPTCGL